MRNQTALIEEIRKALADAGLDVNVRLFKRKRLASSIRIVNKDFSKNFTLDETNKLIQIARQFDMRGPDGRGMDVKYKNHMGDFYRDFCRWDYQNHPQIFWWVYS